MTDKFSPLATRSTRKKRLQKQQEQQQDKPAKDQKQKQKQQQKKKVSEIAKNIFNENDDNGKNDGDIQITPAPSKRGKNNNNSSPSPTNSKQDNGDVETDIPMTPALSIVSMEKEDASIPLPSTPPPSSTTTPSTKNNKKRKKDQNTPGCTSATKKNINMNIKTPPQQELSSKKNTKKRRNTPQGESNIVNKTTTQSQTTPKRAVPPQIDVKVHRFREPNFVPRTILRLASTPYTTAQNIPPSSHLAISREGGSVELVSVDEKWKCVGLVEGIRDRNVDAMVWLCGSSPSEASKLLTGKKEGRLLKASNSLSTSTKVGNANSAGTTPTGTYFCKEHQVAEEAQASRRLFGASHDGTIFEIDFKTKMHLGVIGSGGGAVFCLSTLEGGGRQECCDLFAAGCEDGSVRIYRAASRDESDSPLLELVSTLPSVGSAVLSIAWKRGAGNNGNCMAGSVLYAGVGDGTIRKFECVSASQSARVIGSLPHAVSTGLVLNNSSNDMSTSNMRIKKKSSSSLTAGYQWKATTRITVENRGRRNATKVWALLALDDGTVVSGDSMGSIQFWDGHIGTLIQSFEHNPEKADVLDLSMTLDQSKIMACGIDSKVLCIEKDPTSNETKWILTVQQRPNTHDVNSLAMVYMTDPSGAGGANTSSKVDEFLCSGGVDTKVCSFFASDMRSRRPKIVYKYPQATPLVLAKKARIFALMRNDKVDFYQLGTKISSQSAKNSAIPLDENKAYLGSVGISSMHNLISFDLSDDGKFLAVSDASCLHLFSLSYIRTDEEGMSSDVIVPTKIKLSSNESEACSAIKFVPGSKSKIICASIHDTISVLHINEEENDHKVAIEHAFDKESMSNIACARHYPVSAITVSSDGRFFAVSRNTSGTGSVQVFSLSPNYRYWWSLPCTDAPHSCIQFLGDGEIEPALVVTCNNGSFYIFNVEQRCLSDWSQDLGFPANAQLPDELTSDRLDCPNRLAFNPSAQNKFLMGGQNWFCSIDLDSPIPNRSRLYPENNLLSRKKTSRKRGKSDADKEDSMKNNNFTICVRYTGIILMDFLEDNEMVIVEQPWLGIMNTLPGAMERKRYGN